MARISVGLVVVFLWAFGAQAQINVPLLHFPSTEASGYGSYINIQLGSNAQAVSVLVDTGSATLAVPPASCGVDQSGCSEVACNPQCPLQSGLTQTQLASCAFGSYDSTQSTSAQNIPASNGCNTPSPANSNVCGFSVSYGQGGGCCGMQGFLVQDTMSIGGLQASTILGQIQQVQSQFQEPPSAGIFGFAYESGNCLYGSFSSCGSYGANTAYTCAPSPLTTFLTSNNLANTFSMCFGSLQVPGVLTLGGTNSQFYTGSFQYTPITQGTPYYTVQLLAVGTVSGGTLSPVSASSGVYNGAILDSGTSTLTLPTEVFNELSNVGAAVTCSTNANCASLNIYVALKNIPQLTVPNMYMCGDQGTCMLNPGAVSATTSNPILGYPLLSSYYVTFERSAYQAGFATLSGSCASTCNMHLVEQGCIMHTGCVWSSSSSSCSSASASHAATTAPAATTAAASTATVSAAVAEESSASSGSSAVAGGMLVVVTVVPAVLGLAFILSFVIYRRARGPADAEEALMAVSQETAADQIYAPTQ